MPLTAQSSYSNTQLIAVYGQLTPETVAVNIAPSTTLAAGTLLGELTATPGTFKAYASGNVDGSQVPKGFLMYPVVTDASGNITNIGDFGMVLKTVPMFLSGAFKTASLTGLDANALTVMNGHVISGVLANGIVRFG